MAINMENSIISVSWCYSVKRFVVQSFRYFPSNITPEKWWGIEKKRYPPWNYNSLAKPPEKMMGPYKTTKNILSFFLELPTLCFKGPVKSSFLFFWKPMGVFGFGWFFVASGSWCYHFLGQKHQNLQWSFGLDTFRHFVGLVYCDSRRGQFARLQRPICFFF